MSSQIPDMISSVDLDRLRAEAEEVCATAPDEAERRRTILDAQARILALGEGAFDALAVYEQAASERLVEAVDVSLAVGFRFGRTVKVDGEFSDREREFLSSVSSAGLGLSRDQRLRVLVSVLGLEVGT